MEYKFILCCWISNGLYQAVTLRQVVQSRLPLKNSARIQRFNPGWIKWATVQMNNSMAHLSNNVYLRVSSWPYKVILSGDKLNQTTAGTIYMPHWESNPWPWHQPSSTQK